MANGCAAQGTIDDGGVAGAGLAQAQVLAREQHDRACVRQARHAQALVTLLGALAQPCLAGLLVLLVLAALVTVSSLAVVLVVLALVVERLQAHMPPPMAAVLT